MSSDVQPVYFVLICFKGRNAREAATAYAEYIEASVQEHMSNISSPVGYIEELSMSASVGEVLVDKA